MYFLPDFLKRNFGRPTDTLGDRIVMAVMAGGPLLVGVFGCVLGGVLTDRHVRRTRDRKWGRRLYGVIGYAGAGACYGVAILGAVSGNKWLFAAGVALAGFSNDLTMGPSWAVCQDIGRRYAAIVSGFMNMVGNLGGVTTIFVTAWIMRSTVADRVAAAEAAGASVEAAREAGLIEGSTINLALYALAYFIGVLFWLKIDATKPVVPDDYGAADARM
jgi:ACS family glucarate transporter-like MFS transporter